MTKDTKVVQIDGSKPQEIEHITGEIYVKYPLEDEFQISLRTTYDRYAEKDKTHTEKVELFTSHKQKSKF